MSKNTAKRNAAKHNTAKHNTAKPVAAIDSKRATAAVSAASAERTAQPGIIATIMHLLCDARDAKRTTTSNEMLAELHKRFSGRAVGGLQTTLRAQLSRLPNERNFGISKTRDSGVVMHYAATATAKRDARKVSAA